MTTLSFVQNIARYVKAYLAFLVRAYSIPMGGSTNSDKGSADFPGGYDGKSAYPYHAY